LIVLTSADFSTASAAARPGVLLRSASSATSADLVAARRIVHQFMQDDTGADQVDQAVPVSRIVRQPADLQIEQAVVSRGWWKLVKAA
jgi:hypothetical protein